MVWALNDIINKLLDVINANSETELNESDAESVHENLVDLVNCVMEASNSIIMHAFSIIKVTEEM